MYKQNRRFWISLETLHPWGSPKLLALVSDYPEGMVRSHDPERSSSIHHFHRIHRIGFAPYFVPSVPVALF